MTTLINRTQKTELHHPPGPKGHWLYGTTRAFRRDPLGTMVKMFHEYGDAIRYRFFANLYGYLFFHPEYNKHILLDNNKNYTKMPHPSLQVLRPLLGNGLVTSDGEFWRRQRRLMQPAFHKQRIAEFGAIMTTATEKMLQRWQTAVSADEPLDVAAEMTRLTLEIVGKALFSVDFTGAAHELGEAFTKANHLSSELGLKPFSIYTLRIPFWPSTRRLNRNVQVLHRIVDEMIAVRQANPPAPGTREANDLLSMLLAARDEETGVGMDDQQLRDELNTLVLAGHETTAVALSWVICLLGQHPEVRTQLEHEVDTVLNGRIPTIDDLPQLTFTRMVIDETLRLYPPAYAIARWGNEPDVIGGYDIPANAVITLSPYITHRHPEFWSEPEKFNPERFSPERKENRHRFAYLPFGGGPRICIGNTFALTEATLILAMITQQFRLELPPNHQIEPEPLITLRPKGGVPVFLRARMNG
ncbi:MAG: cytochrome P450 [Chloroflexi bacterium]|nr:MAG: cytochrome P450 [Chloroflexota bacterium]